MFGLFAKKPPRELQAQLGKQGHTVAQTMFHIVQNGELPPHQAHHNNPVKIDNDADLSTLIKTYTKIVEENNLQNSGVSEMQQKINHLARATYGSGNIPDRFTDGSMLLLTSLNSAETISRVYYRDFPEYKPLLEMVNQLAKIVPVALEKIFGQDIPPEVRKVFPHVSSLIEHYRASRY